GVRTGVALHQALAPVERPRGDVLDQRVEAEPGRHLLFRPGQQQAPDALTLAAGRHEDLGQLARWQESGGEPNDAAAIVCHHDGLRLDDLADPARAPVGQGVWMPQPGAYRMPRVPPDAERGSLVAVAIGSQDNHVADESLGCQNTRLPLNPG